MSTSSIAGENTLPSLRLKHSTTGELLRRLYLAKQRPEIQLLLLCSRVLMDSATEERVRAILRNRPDWNIVLRTSVRHGVDALLYRSLGRFGPEHIPQDVRTRLREQAHDNVVNCFFLTAQLLRLLELFNEHGIGAIPFKGPTLAVLAYADLTLRRFGDLDILIRKEDFARAKELLLDQGLRPRQELTKSAEAAYLSSEYSQTWVNGSSGITIDLHWAFLQKRYQCEPDMESLWSRLATVTIAGRTVPTLNTEDLLLYLCLHGTKHCWHRLTWICDIAALVGRNQGLDWDGFLERSRDLDAERVVLLGLALSRDLLNAPLPQRIVSRIDRDRVVPALSANIQRWLFADSISLLAGIEQKLLFSKVRERLGSKLPYLAYQFRTGFALNQRDFCLLALPKGLYFLYYPLRLARLTAKYGRDVVENLISRARIP